MFTFNFEDCKPLPNGKPAYNDPSDPQAWHPVAHALAQVTMMIGINAITEKNAAEFNKRLSMYQRVAGPLLKWGDGVTAYIVERDVQQYVGMRTNASNWTEAEFNKHLLRLLAEGCAVTDWDNRDVAAKLFGDSDEPGPRQTALAIAEAQALKYAAKTKKRRAATRPGE